MIEIDTKNIEIPTANDYSIAATVFDSQHHRSVLIINSATGVKQYYYRKFSEFTAKKGITVITYDYRGISLSLNQNIKEIESNATAWAQVDMEAVLQYTRKQYPQAKITLMGHSIGGQIIGLTKSALTVDK